MDLPLWNRFTSPSPIHILITGAAGQIGYNLTFLFARGFVFDQDLVLHLYDLDITTLRGLKMELEDCCLDHIKEIIITTEIEEAFRGVDVAILVAGIPRKAGMERSDLIAVNKQIMHIHGTALAAYSSPDVRVLVVANPANTNALIVQQSSHLPPQHITCLTRLDQNRATSYVSRELHCPTQLIHNIIIWGNHSTSLQPDLTSAFLSTPDGIKPIQGLVEDFDDFTDTIRSRGEEVIKARKASSAASAAQAISQHLRDWLYGTKKGVLVSMGIYSSGEYGITKGIYFSMPVVCRHGDYHVVEDLKISDSIEVSMALSELELIEERELII
ncbi:malate dehydrogenase [Entamoeba marina]